MIKMFLSAMRKARVLYRVMLGREILVRCNSVTGLTWFGNPTYGGWRIPISKIGIKVGVIDAGVGEDLSFSEDLIYKYGANVVALDPTPKAAQFVNRQGNPSIDFLNHGLAPENGKARFYLPTNQNHVSGSLTRDRRLLGGEMEVELTSLSTAIKRLATFDTLIVKMDIEGAEFDLIDSDDFKDCAFDIDILCIEFHHRWPQFGVQRLRNTVSRLQSLGFECVWRHDETNEEFTFVKMDKRVNAREFHPTV
jgi:FkbM family methyltransferase